MQQKVGDINIYYETYGTGEPLLLIEGFSYASWMWYKQVSELSKHYQVIVFDNRGVGKSDKPDSPYSIGMMADDAAALLHALGVNKAHVLGVSMGGYIAQSLAYSYPQLVQSLILCCTSFGGPKAVPLPQETAEIINNTAGLDQEQILYKGMSVAFTKEYFISHQDEVKKIIEWRLANPQPPYARKHQANAVSQANLEEYTQQIKIPTLIMTGTADRVIPAENSRLLTRAIKGAILIEFPGQGHLFFMEKAGDVNGEIISFLQQHPIME